MADSNPNIQVYTVGNLKITIDRSKCLSCAACTTVAPKTFELDDELISTVKPQDPYDNEDKIKQAVKDCAGGAITIEEIEKDSNSAT